MLDRIIDERFEPAHANYWENGKGAGADIRSLDLYLQEINRTPLLAREEERDLARRVRSGDERALDHLVRAGHVRATHDVG